MCLGRIRTEEQNALRILFVVVRVGHRTIAPGVGNAGDRGRVADARLVIHVIGAEERHELAEQIGLFIVVLRGADPERRVRTRFLADLQQLLADFSKRHIPGNLFPLAVLQFHRRAQAVRNLVHAVFADRSALGTVRAEVDRRIEHRFLADPHAVLHHGVDGAADRAVGADSAFDFDLALSALFGRLRLAHDRERQLRQRRGATGSQTAALEESAAIDRVADKS